MKRPLRLWRPAVLAVITAFVVCTSTAAQSKSFLWKVQSGSRVLYLAGSVHALSADVYPLNPAFERAFQASTVLVEEIDLAQANLLTLGPVLLSKGMYQDGRTFDKAVSKETLALVMKKVEGPMGLELIRSMKPWMVMMMLDGLQAQEAGLDPALGLDNYFFDKAVAAKKPIIALETAESQIDRFDRMSEPLQEQMLRSALEDLDLQKKELAGIIAAWQRGDASSLEKTVLGAFKLFPAVYQSLIVERNNNWMPQMDKCLASASPCLVVVGAAHLVGPDGLLALLQRKGYRIEQQ
jgi:uncharacterized protein YbaP (TraB family)